jgi:hypothetical protein
VLSTHFGAYRRFVEFTHEGDPAFANVEAGKRQSQADTNDMRPVHCPQGHALAGSNVTRVRETATDGTPHTGYWCATCGETVWMS